MFFNEFDHNSTQLLFDPRPRRLLASRLSSKSSALPPGSAALFVGVAWQLGQMGSGMCLAVYFLISTSSRWSLTMPAMSGKLVAALEWMHRALFKRGAKLFLNSIVYPRRRSPYGGKTLGQVFAH